MKKFLILIFPFVLITVGLFMKPHPATASFNPNNLIVDNLFDYANSMTAGQIDTWLNNNFPGSCISTNNGFTAPDPTGYSPNPSQFFYSSSPVSAGQIIYDAAQAYGINPQVLLATLQKEETLVDGSAGCATWRYASAVGYGCTDSGTNSHDYSYPGGGLVTPLYYMHGTAVNSISGSCVNSGPKAGFSEQVIHAAWLFSFSRHKSEGDVNWAVIKGNWNNCDDNNTCPSGWGIPASDACYSGYMTQGSYKRCPTDSSAVFYDGYATIDGSTVHMDDGATAALYVYTPHFSGNQSFDNIFQTWFGPTTSIASGITMHNITQPDITPALGQTISYTVSFTNNFSDSVTIDAIGIVGRLNDINGANRDLGWQGPVTLGAGATQQFTFTSVVHDLGTLYVWPSIYSQGAYTHYNNWGALLSTHIPNIGATLSPGTTSPVTGQTDNLSATITNYEGQAINLDAAGIAARFYGRYNYDPSWSGASTLPVNGSLPISGSITYDKPGHYTEWVSIKIANQYIAVSPTTDLTVSPISPSPQNFQLSYTSTPNLNPALGEDVTVAFNLKNSYGVPVTLDAVGVVGRYDNPYTGVNRDFGWQGPVTFAAGQTKSFSFTTNVSDLKTFYAWAALNYQGNYTHYNNWGFMMSPHSPNLIQSSALTVNGGTQPTIGQTVPVTVTIKNNEPNPIKFSAIGIPARYYSTYNYDAVWQGPGTLAASGQSGDSVTLNGTIKFDKSGPYTIWASILIQGRYTTIGAQKNINI